MEPSNMMSQGVYAFEENAEELAQNVASLGFDLKELIRQKKLIIDYVRVERTESRKPEIMTWRDYSYA